MCFIIIDIIVCVVYVIVFMDVVKSYFEYRVCIFCGILLIEFMGMKVDWV